MAWDGINLSSISGFPHSRAIKIRLEPALTFLPSKVIKTYRRVNISTKFGGNESKRTRNAIVMGADC